MTENNEKNVEKSKDQEKDVSDNKVKELTVEQKLLLKTMMFLNLIKI